ncbi:hypothetical protein BG011_003233 [Mortierella polycephala]|uniref:Uncharacterized protein n=1 Tax=Mortierella polycephala TaxID=41804 RepID=A0A9P6Q1F7_9FUNG|nr:hypothetical protein BG011_003233 [Mortierella polycephala]
MTALHLNAAASFLSNNNIDSATATTTAITSTFSRQPALQPITTTIPSSVSSGLGHVSPPSSSMPFDNPRAIITPTRGSAQPLVLYQKPTHPQQPPHALQQRHQISSLPSPPLSSVEPSYNADFFPKSPLQERCEALETELSALRNRLRRSERSSTIREKQFSLFQQQSTDTQQSFQSLRQQHEKTLAQQQDVQRELLDAKDALASREHRIRQLEASNQEQECKLSAILSDREALSTEMMESHTENAKQQKRLKTSNDKVEKLQQENRKLIEQLQGLRAKVSDAKLDAVDILDREMARGGQVIQELQKESSKYKAEVDRLQDLALMMGNRHVQQQAQLSFFQQQAQQLQQQLEMTQQIALASAVEHGAGVSHTTSAQSSPATSSTYSTPKTSMLATSSRSKHGSLMLGDETLTSLLTSVASVATTSYSRRTRITRRFTVNAPRKEGELILEQRKCEFLMNQISVLQRGYDALRQEKVTLELQLDLMQRQHQYHQQQRQKRRDSQRRTLGHEQSAALSNALATMVSAAAHDASVPSTPLLPTISAAEQAREKTRIQHELEQAQIRAEKEAKAKEAQKLAAKVAAEEAEREAYRLRRQKSFHLKETLASLESKRNRTDSRTIQFSSSEELKHLDHLRLANEQQQSSGEGGMSFQSAAAARASRRIMSPSSSGHYSSTTMSPSPLSSSSSSLLQSSSSSSSSPSLQNNKQPMYYTSSSQHRKSGLHLEHSNTFNIEQCSCCIGAMIEL